MRVERLNLRRIQHAPPRVGRHIVEITGIGNRSELVRRDVLYLRSRHVAQPRLGNLLNLIGRQLFSLRSGQITDVDQRRIERLHLRCIQRPPRVGRHIVEITGIGDRSQLVRRDVLYLRSGHVTQS